MTQKLTAAYLKMNQRERMMTLVISAILFLLLNLFLWRLVLGGISNSRRDLASRKSTRAEQVIYMRERELWAKRQQWIEKTQPEMKGPEEAPNLLEQVKQVADKYTVRIENPAIGSGETTPQHQTAFASIETTSHWPDLVHFLYDVQQPDAFIVFESVNLAVDNNDNTMMRGKFKIAKWFAPANRKKS
jgi:hypothetical protein